MASANEANAWFDFRPQSSQIQTRTKGIKQSHRKVIEPAPVGHTEAAGAFHELASVKSTLLGWLPPART